MTETKQLLTVEKDKTLFLELGDSPSGVKICQKEMDLPTLFLEYLEFQEMPPFDFQCRIIRPYTVLKTPYYSMVIFEVDWAKTGETPKIGLMSRLVSKPGSVALVNVQDAGKEKFAFVTIERFLFGLLLETVRGFDSVKQELAEELDLAEQPTVLQLGGIRINTGLAMTTSPKGDTPISLIKVKAKPDVGKGTYTEKISSVKLLSLSEIRDGFLSGSITDPWFAFGFLIWLMHEKPDVFES